MQNFPALTTLDLEWNQIGNEGAISLAAALPNCPLLTCLNLEHNVDIDAAIKSEIKSLLSLQPQHKATAALVCWNRRRHTVFGRDVNRVFVAFLLAFFRLDLDTNLDMVEETLESFRRFGLDA